jgi:hypothetical protein
VPRALAGGHRVTVPLFARYDVTACAICCLIVASSICFATFRDDRSSIASSQRITGLEVILSVLIDELSGGY